MSVALPDWLGRSNARTGPLPALHVLANRSSVPPLRQRRLMVARTLAAVLSVAGYMLMYLGRDKGAAEAMQAFLTKEARLNQLAMSNEKQAIETGELRQLVADLRQSAQTFGACQPTHWNKAPTEAASTRVDRSGRWTLSILPPSVSSAETQAPQPEVVMNRPD